MLLDAQIYFKSVRAAIRQARRCIFILSWDIDSRIWLVPEGAADGYPEPLGDFLHAVVSEHRELHAYVLNWDFTMLYAMEREWLPAYHLGWHTHQRLHFLMDGRHPVGACHHQKVIVIDDTLAFVGGLDLTSARWDTPAHSAADTRRQDVNGKPYAPFHDVQAAVDGDAALALGMLCRDRWQLAGGCETVAPAPSAVTMWPDCLVVDLSDVPVAISRTVPAFDGTPRVSEIRQLHLDAIASAHESLLFENQYFTSELIAGALARRLAEPHGPEVLIISPNKQSGWLEEATMGVLRARMHDRLRRADIYHHYRMMSPQLDEIDGGALNVHSKVFFADDRLLSIGSANLSNRSMGCDTECNLSIEAVGNEHERARIAAAIARMRARLLAEHLAEVPEVVQKVLIQKGLLSATKQLSQRPRRLVELDPLAVPELDALIPQQSLFDPEEPIDPEALIARWVPRESRKPFSRRFVVMLILSLLLIAGVIALRYPPAQAYLNLYR